MASFPNGRQVYKLFAQPSYLQLVNKRYCARTHYEVLGVKASANAQEIKSAFVELSKQLHPDLNRSDPKTHDKFVKLNESYTVLSKPLSKKEYDISMRAKFRYQQSIQKAYGTHSYDSSAAPPSFDGREGDMFWDEDLWAMRDRSQDKYYESKPYYSVHGIKKVNNNFIVIGCFLFMSICALISVTIIRDRQEKHKDMLDRLDKQNSLIHKRARLNAELYGNEKQLQLLMESIAKSRAAKLAKKENE